MSLRASGGSYGGGSEVLIIDTLVFDKEHKSYGLDSYNQKIDEELMQTIRINGGGDSMPKVISTSKTSYHTNAIVEQTGALVASDYKDPPTILKGEHSMNSIVRRLTPLECTRLQGFPDGWVDIGDWLDSKGKFHKDSDSPKYAALGNSIALPFWEYLARRIAAQYERPATMGSLFDGIGGFPLAFERAGCKAVWASEIEEFPMAVTKYHFGEE